MNTKETIRTAEENLQQAAEEKYPSDYSLAQSNNKFRQEGFIAGAKSDAAREYWEGQETVKQPGTMFFTEELLNQIEALKLPDGFNDHYNWGAEIMKTNIKKLITENKTP